jgi:hypothetical protein
VDSNTCWGELIAPLIQAALERKTRLTDAFWWRALIAPLIPAAVERKTRLYNAFWRAE